MTRHRHRKLAPFVPLDKATIKTPAWKALSHGARSLYLILKGRYNSRLQNGVYVSSRLAQEELGRYSSRNKILSWFRELQHYGFIVMVSPAHHGLNGHGRSPHWRLTEEAYLAALPTRDFLKWDGSIFREEQTPARTVAQRERLDLLAKRRRLDDLSQRLAAFSPVVSAKERQREWLN